MAKEYWIEFDEYGEPRKVWKNDPVKTDYWDYGSHFVHVKEVLKEVRDE